MVNERRAVGVGSGSALVGALGVIAWARGAMEALGDVQLLLELGLKILTVLLLLGGAASVLWGLGAFDKLAAWLRPKPRRIPATDLAYLAENIHDWKVADGMQFELGKAMRQGAVDGAITIYGRKMETRHPPEMSDMYPLVAIPGARFADLLVIFPAQLGDNHLVKACDVPVRQGEHYMDLYVGTPRVKRWLKYEAVAWKGSLLRGKAAQTV